MIWCSVYSSSMFIWIAVKWHRRTSSHRLHSTQGTFLWLSLRCRHDIYSPSTWWSKAIVSCHELTHISDSRNIKLQNNCLRVKEKGSWKRNNLKSFRALAMWPRAQRTSFSTGLRVASLQTPALHFPLQPTTSVRPSCHTVQPNPWSAWLSKLVWGFINVRCPISNAGGENFKGDVL